MDRGGLPAVLTALMGGAVLGALGHTVFGPGNYYHLPALSTTAPGLLEAAVVVTAITGISAVVVGVMGLFGYHPRAPLVATLIAAALLARPAYVDVAYGDLAFAIVGLLGAILVGAAAAFVVVVETRVVLSRWHYSETTGGTPG